jgi:hypothetical protein
VTSTTGRLRLTLDLDITALPIQGQLVSGGGSTQAFFGWMQLSQAIEGTLAQARSDLEDRGKNGPEPGRPLHTFGDLASNGLVATRDFGPFFGFIRGCPAAATLFVRHLLERP